MYQQHNLMMDRTQENKKKSNNGFKQKTNYCDRLIDALIFEQTVG